MKFTDLVRSLRALFAHPARALLTLLGIVIGSGAVILVAALVRGGEDALVRTNQRATDSDLVTVFSKATPAADRNKTTRELSRRDASELEASPALGGARVGAEAGRETRAELVGAQAAKLDPSERKRRITLVSATAASQSLYRLSIADGRFIDEDDVATRRRVCVVGREVADKLFPGQRPGPEFRLAIEGEIWTVIGVLADKPLIGSTDGTHIWNRKVLIPETTYDSVLAPRGEVRRIYARSVNGPANVDGLRGIVDRFVLRRHFGVRNFEVDDPNKKSEERMILAVIRVLLIGSGLVALFVGGINVTNVMLVSVTERTREIGLRRALGATKHAILAQFLLEASALALIGAAIGVLGGSLLSLLAALGLEHWLGQWSFRVEPWSVILAVGSAFVTGLLAGTAPAMRAAGVDPIQALRVE